MEQRFAGILSVDKPDNTEADLGHFYDAVRSRQEQRILQVARIASHKGFDLNVVKDLNIYEYYLYVEEIMNELNEAKGKNGHANTDMSEEQIAHTQRLKNMANKNKDKVPNES